VDRIAEQRDDDMGRNHKINKMELKQGHLQYLHVSKEVPTRHHYREIPNSLQELSILGCLSKVSVR